MLLREVMRLRQLMLSLVVCMCQCLCRLFRWELLAGVRELQPSRPACRCLVLRAAARSREIMRRRLGRLWLLRFLLVSCRFWAHLVHSILRKHIRSLDAVVLRAVLCVLGIACLAVARLLRTDRRRAEARLAALTRHVPGEVWWLAAILALLTMVFSMDPYTGYSPFELWYYGWMDSSLTDVLRLLALLPANAAALLVLVWVLWLRRITRKNAEPDQRWSLLGALKNMLLAKELKLPVQKRLRRCAAVGIFSLILIPIGASPAILSILDRVFYDGYALSWYFLLFLFLLLYVLLFCWTISSYRRITRTARDIGLLADQVTAIRDGDLETPLDLPADADLRQTAEQLNGIQAGLHRALAEQNAASG